VSQPSPAGRRNAKITVPLTCHYRRSVAVRHGHWREAVSVGQHLSTRQRRRSASRYSLLTSWWSHYYAGFVKSRRSAARRRAARVRGNEQPRLTLERLIDENLADPDEIMIYEVMSDPELRMIEKSQRSLEGQYRRRIRRRAIEARLKSNTNATE
jgi:hypothetical protein